MKRIMTIIAGLVACAGLSADPTITGTVSTTYASRTSGQLEKGVQNKFVYDIAMDSVLWKGTVLQTPTIFSPVLGRVEQTGQVAFDLTVLVRNPANPADAPRAVGKLVGAVPVDSDGVYRYDNGNLRIGIDAMGASAAFESRATGSIRGTPPENKSRLAQAKQDVLRVTKTVNGKTVALAVSKYDRLLFQTATLPAGPFARSFPATTVSGEMLFDYDRDAWYFNGLTLSYTENGKQVSDRITGNIKWVEQPAVGGIRNGAYQFDIRVNEPQGPDGEAAVFAATSSADEEAAFFATSSTMPSLVGEVTFKDTLRGDVLVASSSTWNLRGQGLNRGQTVALGKLLLVHAIGPFSEE